MDTVTLYVWAGMGDHDLMQTMAVDVSATNENVVKVTASTIANPNIVATALGNEIVGARWLEDRIDGGTLNPRGNEEAELVVGARSGAFSTTRGDHSLTYGEYLPARTND